MGVIVSDRPIAWLGWKAISVARKVVAKGSDAYNRLGNFRDVEWRSCVRLAQQCPQLSR